MINDMIQDLIQNFANRENLTVIDLLDEHLMDLRAIQGKIEELIEKYTVIYASETFTLKDVVKELQELLGRPE